MVQRTGFGCGCGCRERARREGVEPGFSPHGSTPFGGLFSTALNVAGAFVGDPALGSQLASQAGPAFAKIKETPEQIAAHVSPALIQRLSAGTLPDPAGLSQQSQQIAAAIMPQVAAELAAQGYTFAPGTVGADLQNPSYLNAFGGENARWVLLGGVALGAFLLLREL